MDLKCVSNVIRELKASRNEELPLFSSRNHQISARMVDIRNVCLYAVALDPELDVALPPLGTAGVIVPDANFSLLFFLIISNRTNTRMARGACPAFPD